MSKADAIAQLQSLRREAQDRARLRSRLTIQEYMDKDTADADVAALTIAIKTVQSASNLRPSHCLTALHMAYWRRGEQAQTPIECIALDDYRKECLWHVRPGNIDSRKEIISQAALMMLEDVYPEAAGKEAKTDDNQ